MQYTLVLLGTLLNLAQVTPYLLGITKGKARPNIVTWSTWTLLTVIGALAAFAKGDWQTGWVVAANAIGTGAVVVLGLRYGYAKMTRLDAFCQVAALCGLVTWPFMHDPSLAVITVVVIDTFALLPTIHHAYVRPHEEVWQAYALAWGAALCGFLALDHITVVSALYLMYLIAADSLLVGIIVVRRRRLQRGASRRLSSFEVEV